MLRPKTILETRTATFFTPIKDGNFQGLDLQNSRTTMYKEEFENIKNNNTDTFLKDVLNGLVHTPKSLPSKYFYDDKGNTLFQKIMDLEEYYPTKEEKDIFNTYKEDIISEMGRKPFLLVDLGAGDAEKTNILLQYLAQSNSDFTYMPIDISAEILDEVAKQIRKELPGIKIESIAAEYFEALKHLDAQDLYIILC